LLLPPARHRAGGRSLDDRQRVLQGSDEEAADGIRGRGAEAPRRQSGRIGGVNMLVIRDLHVEVDGKSVLKGLDLTVESGQVHAIMGPNGSGKSTLAHVLAGRPGYEVTKGSVTYDGHDLLALEPEIRARKGVFLAFQYPIEIPG